MRLARDFSLRLFVMLTVVSFSGVTWAAASHSWPFCMTRTVTAISTSLSVENLTRSSDLVVMGNVTQVGPSQVMKDSIITWVTVDTKVVLKGDRQQHKLILHTQGGTVGCYSVFAVDQPKFTVGEQVLLFLSGGDNTGSRTNMTMTGGTQGKYSIVNGTAQTTSSANTVPLYDLVTMVRQWHSDFGPFDKGGFYVINNYDNWLRLWATRCITLCTDPKLPDFTSSTILVAFMGWRPSSGYTIKIDRTEPEDGTLVAHVSIVEPGAACHGLGSAATSPQDILEIPKTNQPIDFVTEYKIQDCSQGG